MTSSSFAVDADPGSPARPQGRDQIREAVLEAARALIAEHGPDGFSVRAIADRAGVNHALVHRHFGTKDAVLEQVLSAEAAAVATAIAERTRDGIGLGPDDIAGLLETLAAFPTYWRALVHAVLESPEVAVPGTAATTELFRAMWAGVATEDAAATSVAAASVLGWLLFGGFVVDAMDADPDEVRRGIAAQVAALL